MKNHLKILFFGILAGSTVSITSFAAAKTADKMTCEDFIALDEVTRPRAVYWADGYNWFGNPDDAYVDFTQEDQLVPLVVEDCTRNPKHLFVKKVKSIQKQQKS